MAASLSTATAMPIAGVNFKERYVPSLENPRKLALGTPTIGDGNDTWVYVQADVPVTAGITVVAVNVTAAGPTFGHITSAAGGVFTADVAFATGEVGWVHKSVSPLGNP